MLRLIKKRISRVVYDVYLPKKIKIGDKELGGEYVRIAEVSQSITTSDLSIDECKTIRYEVLHKDWIEVDKKIFKSIVNVGNVWGMDYIGTFKKEEKIIGIKF